MKQEAVEEIVGRQRHGFASVGGLDAIVLPFERDAVSDTADDPRGSDGDAVE
jgi:hypothetical protein